MKYPILKSTLRVAGLLIAIIVLFSQLIQCKNNTEEELIPSLDIKETSISSLAGGSTQFLTVDAIHTDWQVEVPVADQKWCIASKVEGRLKVETTENSDLSLRSTTIVVRATADKNLSKTVELTQFGKEPVIITGFSKKEFSSESGQFDLTVSSNIDYTLTLDPADATWIRKIDMPQGKASGVTSKDYRFEYDSNNGGDYRTVFLLFKQIGGTVQAHV